MYSDFAIARRGSLGVKAQEHSHEIVHVAERIKIRTRDLVDLTSDAQVNLQVRDI